MKSLKPRSKVRRPMFPQPAAQSYERTEQLGPRVPAHAWTSCSLLQVRNTGAPATAQAQPRAGLSSNGMDTGIVQGLASQARSSEPLLSHATKAPDKA